ncbi:MAG: Unknown protein [uncultured Aureispira sp.]|uniref:DUF1795 domain-containing protein n=1 Tax=uncultured Aureispira sp. TaxID=1331704 RepID=A0A6S6UAN0_9BACT|nr:MAG: Unknown protein [uncultured Aureispira sp.]
MNKLPLSLFLLIALLCFSCAEEEQTADFSAINTTKTNEHTRIEGTKAFAVIPSAYVYKEALARYQKQESLYFQVMEMPTSYEEAKVNLSKKAIESTGAKLDLYKEFKVNAYDGIYFEGPSKYPGETKLGIWFGDATFVTSVVAVCKNTDVEGKQELMKILRTVFYDKGFELDPFELASFTFKKDSFQFKYNAQINTMFIFTPNGTEDSDANKEIPVITIAPLPFMPKKGAENYTNELIQRYETQQRATFLSEKMTELELVDQSVSIFEAEIEMAGQVSYLYQTVLLGKESSLLFMGTCMKNKEENRLAFERALQAVRFKE